MMKQLVVAFVVCLLLSACSQRVPPDFGDVRKAAPWIPASTQVIERGKLDVLVDSISRPFLDDQDVCGSWWVVDFVEDKATFNPAARSWPFRLYLDRIDALPDGILSGDMRGRWTRGHLLSDGDFITDSSYELKEIGGSLYMFLEWKAGGYALLHQAPGYYVLRKVQSAPTEPPNQTPSYSNTASGDDVIFQDRLSENGALQVVQHPPAMAFRRTLLSLPSRDPNSTDIWQVDLRSADLSTLDLRRRLADLLVADFDSVTKWPTRLPRGFSPQRLMDLGRNPGLGVRSLHSKGITGKGVGIAIIDQSLLVEHDEYKDQLRLYEEVHWLNNDGGASMHGAAVASIAVGKSVGVAPDADLYFIANWPGAGAWSSTGTFQHDLASMAKAIDRIITINDSLPTGRRIRVISISLGVNRRMIAYDQVEQAIGRAAKEGIYVVHCVSDPVLGIGHNPVMNPDDFGSYDSIGLWRGNYAAAEFPVLIPAGNRCTASPTGPHDYVFYRGIAGSWVPPYVAGLYALACQVKPDITPEAFWSVAKETVEMARLGPIINPGRLVEALRP